MADRDARAPAQLGLHHPDEHARPERNLGARDARRVPAGGRCYAGHRTGGRPGESARAASRRETCVNLARAATIILAKELRTEFRTLELLQTTVVFVLVVLVLFSFTFDPTAAESRRFGPGLLWLALLFAGSLMLHPSFTREQSNETLVALRMAPIEPVSILGAKILANFCFLLVAELVLLPVFAALYNLRIVPVLGRLVAVLVLGTLALSIVGTVFAAISSQARMRELLLPLLLLPLLTPALIASAEATAALFEEPPALSAVWLGVLAAFDTIFLTVTWLFGEYLLEE